MFFESSWGVDEIYRKMEFQSLAPNLANEAWF